MFHKKRTWSVAAVATPEELAEKLTEHSWTLCTAFRLQGYLFLNDATSGDGAAEFAVVKEPDAPGKDYLQVESITFSWCTKDEALDYIVRSVRGEYDGEGNVVTLRLDTSESHRCPQCA